MVMKAETKLIKKSQTNIDLDILNELLIQKGVITKAEIQEKREIKLKAIQEKFKLKPKI